MTRILGLDTATHTSGIAILDDERVLAEARHDASGRSADLLVAIDAACTRAGLAPTELDAVAVGAGPGSFTGLRIGMATAKGIAFAAGRPLWIVSSLAALAADARASLEPPRGVICAVLDARRGEVFAGCFRAPTLEPVGTERVLSPGELADWARELAGAEPLSFAGDALANYRRRATRACRTAHRRPRVRGTVVHPAIGGRGEISRRRARRTAQALGLASAGEIPCERILHEGDCSDCPGRACGLS